MMTDQAINFAERDGVNLAYIEAGTGEPALVFVHGWTCNLSHWRHQTAEFSKDHRVLAVDLRGHGQSARPDQDYSIQGFADDVDWLIQTLGLSRPVVVGHSMGGVVAAALARKSPGSVCAVILIDSPIVPFGPQLRPVVDGILQGLKGPGYRQLAEGFLRSFMFSEQDAPDLREEIVSSSILTPQQVMHSALASTFEAAALQGPLPVPSLFIRAATQYASADQIREHIPGIEITEIDCAHFVQLFSPEETNEAIRKFLESLPG
jgi:pimeloyl-ACP methyl ester carboxylesterase